VNTEIKIQQVIRYSEGELEREANYAYDWNAKVLYKRSNSFHRARIYIDYFNKKINIAKEQAGDQVYTGLEQALNNYAITERWFY
jgi:hypothetical protein